MNQLMLQHSSIVGLSSSFVYIGLIVHLNTLPVPAVNDLFELLNHRALDRQTITLAIYLITWLSIILINFILMKAQTKS